MGVREPQRKQKPFEARDHAVELKKKIRELSIIENFGYKVRESKEPRNFSTWSETSRERWREQEAKRLERLKYLDANFLAQKRAAVDADIMRMMYAIASANCLSPQNIAEADERRIHQDRAIAACEQLRVDLQDIMDTLPINKNWMTERIEPEIEKEIALLKGWRKSDNGMRANLYAEERKRGIRIIRDGMKEAAEDLVLRAVYAALNIPEEGTENLPPLPEGAS